MPYVNIRVAGTLTKEQKQQIAKVVADRIPYNTSLFINIGTTTEAIASALRNHQRLRVITNNLNVASILSGNENFDELSFEEISDITGKSVGALKANYFHAFKKMKELMKKSMVSTTLSFRRFCRTPKNPAASWPSTTSPARASIRV